MARQRILIIEDDEDIQELVRFNLQRENYTVLSALDGEKGLERIRAELPDLVLLDLMLPGMDGLQVCRTMRGDPRTAGIPVIMLTAKGEESDIVVGLELGADDYLTKPFSPRVLIARMRNVLRRRAREMGAGDEVVRIFELTIDPQRHEVRVGKQAIDLTATEFAVLHYLARHPGWVYTRQQIVDAVKGTDYPVTDRAVDVQLVGLRRKLGACGEYIETVRGVGYRFREPG